VIREFDAQHPAWVAQARAIYEESFPPAERVPFADLVAYYLTNDAMYAWAAHSADALVGFAFTLTLQGTGAELLCYLAVASEQRNCGVGAELLQAVVAAVRARGTATGILLEVESPEEVPEPERTLRQRRIAFYRRHGAEIACCAPIYQSLNLADGGTLPMHLMWLPLRDAADGLEGPCLRACVRAIYEQGYGLPSDHPLVREALDRLSC
jgi:ribosomal protein S18 acetylase RimI-like enzyme